MIPTALELPHRPGKPRRRGITMVIDNGLPTGAFRDHLASAGDLIDFVKFGWGTAVVSRNLRAKIDAAAEHGIGFFFGGTLFEKHLLQGRFRDYWAFCRAHGCRYVEVSNGTAPIGNDEKARYVEKLADEFVVFSEVGLKDTVRSEQLGVEDWIACVREDLDAGASLVIAEARESGRSGICHADGRLRSEVVDGILSSGVDVSSLLFEAPTKDLQTAFIRRVGPNVNLGNVAPGDVVALETLRLGLRSDTLIAVGASPAAQHGGGARSAAPLRGGREIAAAPNF
jgi:phosphosulfolactate synthase